MALPSCVKLLDHYAEDKQGTIFTLDPLNKPTPDFVTGLTRFDTLLQDALNQSPRADLAALLHRPTKPDLASISALQKAPGSPYAFTVALADLTAGKLTKPHYASFHDHDAIYPASLAKVGPIYGAHQLEFDATQKAAQAPAATAADAGKLQKWVFAELRKDWKAKGLKSGQQPDLEAILVVDKATKKVVFTPGCSKQMDAITHFKGFGTAAINAMNNAMAFLMKGLHAPYLGSALLQSGLCDPNTGGFWLWDSWGERWNCGGGVPQLYPKQPSTEVMAWSAATYLTLLAQRRLVSPSTSDEIAAILIDGDMFWLANAFKAKFAASEVADLKTTGKEGAWGGFASEALIIERTTAAGKALRYVVACFLSSDRPAKEYPVTMAEPDPDFRTVWNILLRAIVEAIIPALDAVIVANNP
jgi:hypothetical protein